MGPGAFVILPGSRATADLAGWSKPLKSKMQGKPECAGPLQAPHLTTSKPQAGDQHAPLGAGRRPAGQPGPAALSKILESPREPQDAGQVPGTEPRGLATGPPVGPGETGSQLCPCRVPTSETKEPAV